MLFTLFSSYVQSGATPLWTASFSGHQKCMELLIDAGANVDVPKEVSVSSCTHISEATSHKASPCSVGPLDTRASHVCVESTGSWCTEVRHASRDLSFNCIPIILQCNAQ